MIVVMTVWYNLYMDMIFFCGWCSNHHGFTHFGTWGRVLAIYPGTIRVPGFWPPKFPGFDVLCHSWGTNLEHLRASSCEWPQFLVLTCNLLQRMILHFGSLKNKQQPCNMPEPFLNSNKSSLLSHHFSITILNSSSIHFHPGWPSPKRQQEPQNTVHRKKLCVDNIPSTASQTMCRPWYVGQSENWGIPWKVLPWLVVWNIFIFPYIGNLIIPIDFHIFQRVQTTNQKVLPVSSF